MKVTDIITDVNWTVKLLHHRDGEVEHVDKERTRIYMYFSIFYLHQIFISYIHTYIHCTCNMNIYIYTTFKYM